LISKVAQIREIATAALEWDRDDPPTFTVRLKRGGET
jgi:hypothetical protein